MVVQAPPSPLLPCDPHFDETREGDRQKPMTTVSSIITGEDEGRGRHSSMVSGRLLSRLAVAFAWTGTSTVEALGCASKTPSALPWLSFVLGSSHHRPPAAHATWHTSSLFRLSCSRGPIDRPEEHSARHGSDELKVAPSSSSSSLVGTTRSLLLSRSEAARVMDETILPRNEYGTRLNVGRDAQGLLFDNNNSQPRALTANDPRLAYTYGEFPLSSFDALLDVALKTQLNVRTGDDDQQHRRPIRLVDVGSGCGRLGLYASLSRSRWDVSGIECAPLLHQQAMRATQRAVDAGYIYYDDSSPGSGDDDNDMSSSTIRFHCSMAGDDETSTVLLAQADLVFAYSTTWECSGFSTHTSSMILSEYWHNTFTRCCSPGCVVITTDRSLDATTSQWNLLAQVSVDNPEVGGSIGYIQQRVE